MKRFPSPNKQGTYLARILGNVGPVLSWVVLALLVLSTSPLTFLPRPSPATQGAFGLTDAGSEVTVLPAALPASLGLGARALDWPASQTIGQASGGLSTSGQLWFNDTSSIPAPFDPSEGAAAFDPTDGYLAFAGLHTWALIGSKWTMVDPSSPSPYGMAPDFETGGLVGVSGSGCGLGCGSDTTWTYLGGTWTQVFPAQSPPSGIFQRVAYVPGYVYLVEASNHSKFLQTWDYDAETNTWSNLTIEGVGAAPSNRIGFSINSVSDEDLLLFGGVAYNASRGTAGPFENDTWSTYPDEGSWYNDSSNAVSNHPPTPRAGSALGYDASTSQYVLFGGYAENSASYIHSLAETWVQNVNPSTWMNETNAPSPEPLSWVHAWGGMVYDPIDTTLFLLGGCRTPDGLDPLSTCFDQNQTWSWPSSPGRIFPVASYSPVNPVVGSPVYLNVTSISGGNAPYSFHWRFGDGGSADVMNATHIYLATGTFTAELWVNDSDGNSGTTSLTFQVSVSPLHTTAWASPAGGAPPLVIGFGATVGGGIPPYSYSWRFGDGGTSQLATPTHTYASSGTYDVQEWTNDSDGHSAQSEVTVHVYTPLVVGVQASPNPAVLGQPVNFTSTVAGGVPPYSYSWSFGDGGTGGDLQNITHIYTTNGPFVATLTVTDAIQAFAQATLNISIALEVGLIATSTSLQVGQVSYLTPTAVGGAPPYTFSWPGLPSWCALLGPSSPHPNAAMCTPSSTGTFTIQVSVMDAKGRVATSEVTLSVSQPTGIFGLPGNDGYYLLVGILGVAIVSLVVATRHRAVPRRPNAADQDKSDVPSDVKGALGKPDEGPVETLAPGQTDPAEDIF